MTILRVTRLGATASDEYARGMFARYLHYISGMNHDRRKSPWQILTAYARSEIGAPEALDMQHSDLAGPVR